MAHPLTQQPPSSLPFPFAARPSPLSFGFGHPSTPTGLTTPTRVTNTGFNWSSPVYSPTKTSLARPRSDSNHIVSSSTLKRTRRSRSPSSSPPLSPNSPASSSSQVRGSTSKVDLSAVAGLALQDGPSKSAKRSRFTSSENPQTSSSDGIDVGILLATLPSSAHLPILMQLLRTHPTLSETVLNQIPQPEVKTCVREIQTAFEAVQKAAGGSLGMREASELFELRRWERVRNEAEIFCRTASTYIQFFTSNAKPPLEAESIFAFLQPLTTCLQTLLSVVPVTSPPTNPVLELAKLVLSIWTLWLTSLSAEVNQRGGMYPHSVVTTWADTMDRLTSKSTTGQWDANHSAHWSLPSSRPANEDRTSFDESFRQALMPLRERFLTEVGWMIGRRAV
ncbi:hypothetical protein I302_104447 [Kwoniella bestiolae CBS 10118]|uniref:Tethering factor for nuclear proteasome STS1 n=1 Tax=Kwoniella bestiolae CBS 10118 TaxID=1296100 RepID=A0A1B9GBA1_9TREE|nr:hypothetical protein I302_03152 [Kwoniella bestiolae CBS 10118]OCF28296.1 hypothetical protein I302_03152 [Kwoniella bestiolae CBS 10118]